MIGMRKVIGFLMVTMLAAFALSSGAAFGADKQYTLAMSPLAGTSTITTMTATFTNKGNSSFNSLTLTVPNNYSITGTPTANRGNVSYSGGVITVLYINAPAGTGQVITVTMSGVTTSGPTCGTGVTGIWTAVLWTGSTLGGSNFNQVGPAASTVISPLCYTVTSSSSGNGTISPATVQTVAANATKVFTLTPATGYNSASVTGTCGGTLVGNNFTTAAVTANCTVIANFAINVYTVTPSAGANGSISPSTPQPVNYNGTKAFTLTPGTGYHIASVGGTCGGTLSGITYTTAAVTADCTVAASFAIDTFTVTPSAGTGGSISPSIPQTVNYNDTTAFTVTADGTHYITSVTGCGGTLSGNTFTTGPVTAACTVTASFALKTLTISSAPTSAVAGTPFVVIVGETPGGLTPTMTSDCGATQTNVSSPTSTTFTVTIPSQGVCNITFSVPGYTQALLSPFKAYKGVLFCGDYDSVLGSSNHFYDPDLPSTQSGLGSSYVGTPGWGLRRGPNRDGSACVPVNYTCDLNAITNVASCSFDKASGQLATFKYLFLWTPKPPVDGWTNYRPQVSWNIANPDNTFALPDWVPLLACISDLFPVYPPDLPTTILPVIPSVPPFTDPANAPPPPATNTGHSWYQPGVTALVCGGQQGWTAVGSPPNALLQVWNIVIDESDLVVKGP